MTNKERAARWAKQWEERAAHPKVLKPRSTGSAHSKAVLEGMRKAKERKAAEAAALEAQAAEATSVVP